MTHWGWVTNICITDLTIIGSDNGLSPERHQAIILTNTGILLIGPLGINFSEILMEINMFSFKKIYLKMSSEKCRPFCLSLSVLKVLPVPSQSQQYVHKCQPWKCYFNWYFELCHLINLWLNYISDIQGKLALYCQGLGHLQPWWWPSSYGRLISYAARRGHIAETYCQTSNMMCTKSPN